MPFKISLTGVLGVLGTEKLRRRPPTLSLLGRDEDLVLVLVLNPESLRLVSESTLLPRVFLRGVVDLSLALSPTSSMSDSRGVCAPGALAFW